MILKLGQGLCVAVVFFRNQQSLSAFLVCDCEMDGYKVMHLAEYTGYTV